METAPPSSPHWEYFSTHAMDLAALGSYLNHLPLLFSYFWPHRPPRSWQLSTLTGLNSTLRRQNRKQTCFHDAEFFAQFSFMPLKHKTYFHFFMLQLKKGTERKGIWRSVTTALTLYCLDFYSGDEASTIYWPIWYVCMRTNWIKHLASWETKSFW